MRRNIVSTAAVLALSFGAAAAPAAAHPGHGSWGGGPPDRTVLVEGTITAGPTTATPDQFSAEAYLVSDGPEHGAPSSSAGEDASGSDSGSAADSGATGGSAPPETAVTITTDDTTRFDVDGNHHATAADLAAGQRFVAIYSADGTQTLAELAAEPAQAVVARTPPPTPAAYAFVGTVTATDTTDTPETITVDVSQTLPSSLATAGSSETFTVGAGTLVIGGSGASLFGGSLTNVAVGDTVAGGLIGPSGETLSQVEAEPLKVLIDFPAAATSSGPTSSSGTNAMPSSGTSTTTESAAETRAAALAQAVRILGGSAATGSTTAPKTAAHSKHVKKHAKKHAKKAVKHVKKSHSRHERRASRSR